MHYGFTESLHFIWSKKVKKILLFVLTGCNIQTRSKKVKVKVLRIWNRGVRDDMGISDIIAGFINDLLSEEDGTAEVQRADLANRFNCVPSQINYVISTRFSPEHGYIVESRRGGGGYIRITRVRTDPKMLVMHTVNSVGDRIGEKSVAALVSNLMENKAINTTEARMILSATGSRALLPISQDDRDRARASIFKQMLVNTGM